MGEKERGKPDLAKEAQLQSFSIPLQTSASSSSTTSTCSMPDHTTSQPIATESASVNDGVVRPNSDVKPEDTALPVAPRAPGWPTAWRHFIYEKWRLCAFIALAVMVSRYSTRGWTWGGSLHFSLSPLHLCDSHFSMNFRSLRKAKPSSILWLDDATFNNNSPPLLFHKFQRLRSVLFFFFPFPAEYLIPFFVPSFLVHLSLGLVICNNTVCGLHSRSSWIGASWLDLNDYNGFWLRLGWLYRRLWYHDNIYNEWWTEQASILE